MKLKEFGQRGGVRPWRSLRSAPLKTLVTLISAALAAFYTSCTPSENPITLVSLRRQHRGVRNECYH